MVGLFPQSTTPGGFSFGQAAAPQTGVVSPFLQTANPTSTAVVPPFSATGGGFNFNPASTAGQTGAAGLGTGLFTVPQTSGVAPSPFGQPNASSVAAVAPFSAAVAPFSAAAVSPFSATATPSPGFSFAATSASPVAATGLGLFSVPSSGVSATTGAAPGFSFAAPKPVAPVAGIAPPSLFNLTPQSTAATGALNLGLGGSLPTTSTTVTTSAVASALQVGGLGGAPAVTSTPGGDNSLGKTEGQSIKEVPLPLDIFSSIAEFETYKDSEKKACEENVRQTAAPFHKLGEDAKKLRQHVNKLANQHQQVGTSARKMKGSVVEQSSNVEMAIRTQATPASLQGDNKAPEIYFLNLLKAFEEKMTFCRNKIEEVDNCSKANSMMKEITPEDLKEALRKEHEIVKSLAAKVYTLHSRLGELYERAQKPNVSKPEMLFKPTIGEDSGGGVSPRSSTVLRPCFTDVSGLFEFQMGQQRAKSISLNNTAPPTLALNQTTLNSSLFGNSSIGGPLFQANQAANNSMFKPSPFGNNTMSPFNTTGFGQTSSIFGGANAANSSNAFGVLKPFGKPGDTDETQKKRRM